MDRDGHVDLLKKKGRFLDSLPQEIKYKISNLAGGYKSVLNLDSRLKLEISDHVRNFNWTYDRKINVTSPMNRSDVFDSICSIIYNACSNLMNSIKEAAFGNVSTFNAKIWNGLHELSIKNIKQVVIKFTDFQIIFKPSIITIAKGRTNLEFYQIMYAQNYLPVQFFNGKPPVVEESLSSFQNKFIVDLGNSEKKFLLFEENIERALIFQGTIVAKSLEWQIHQSLALPGASAASAESTSAHPLYIHKEIRPRHTPSPRRVNPLSPFRRIGINPINEQIMARIRARHHPTYWPARSNSPRRHYGPPPQEEEEESESEEESEEESESESVETLEL